MSNDKFPVITRRKALHKGGQALAAIAVVVAGVRPAFSKA
jgi:hypothetical protein